MIQMNNEDCIYYSCPFRSLFGLCCQLSAVVKQYFKITFFSSAWALLHMENFEPLESTLGQAAITSQTTQQNDMPILRALTEAFKPLAR